MKGLVDIDFLVLYADVRLSGIDDSIVPRYLPPTKLDRWERAGLIRSVSFLGFRWVTVTDEGNRLIRNLLP